MKEIRVRESYLLRVDKNCILEVTDHVFVL